MPVADLSKKLQDVWTSLIDRHGSTRSVALIRIGLVLVLWARFADNLLVFHHPTEPGRWALSVAFYILSSILLVGWYTRIANVALAILLWWMYVYWGFWNGISPWTHHHTYLLMISFTWLSFTPSGTSFSVDRWLALRKAKANGTEAPPEEGPLWGLNLLAVQVSAVYFFSAYDKSHAFFLSGDHLVAIFQHYYTGSDPILIPGFALICEGLAIFTVVLEYVYPFALFVPRWQKVLFPIGIVFHAILYVSVPVSTFTVTMWVLYLAYVQPKTVDDFIYSMTTSAKSTINGS